MRFKNGKTHESMMNLDRYIYKIIRAVDGVTNTEFESLNRQTE